MFRPSWSALALATSTWLGCAASAPPPVEAYRLAGVERTPTLAEPDAEPATAVEVPAPPADRLVLITLDGVRWQEIFHGVDPVLAREYRLPEKAVVDAEALTPRLHRAMASGMAVGGPDGEPMHASGPNFASLPGYLELLTGAPSTCQRNDCPRTERRTLLDACREAPDKRAEGVAMIASWENLENAATRDEPSFLISAGRHHGAHRDLLREDAVAATLLRRGEKAFPPPGQNDYRPDRLTAPLALRHLRTKAPRCLFVGLGDTDEYAHLGDYGSYLRALREADRFVGDVLEAVADQGDAGARTTVWITTDHGRADTFVGHGARAPESSRVWLIATGAGVSTEGGRTIRRLADVAPELATILGLAEVPAHSR
jgi:hypothetical protein